MLFVEILNTGYMVMILPALSFLGKRHSALNNRGIALVTAMIVLLTLSFIGAAAIRFATTDIQIGGNYKASSQAFNNAEAGVQYAIAQIRDKFMAGTLKIDSTITPGNPLVLNYAFPGSFPLQPGGKFPFSNYTSARLYLSSADATNTYKLQTTGDSSGSVSSLEVVLKIPVPKLSGVFADGSVKLKNGGGYESYDSRTSPNPPGVGNFTHKAHVGSNTSVELKSAGSVINGDLILGKSIAGVSATDLGGGTVQYGTRPVYVPRIEPDPLGVAGLVSFYSNPVNNNNPGKIVGNTIVGNKTLPAGNYYLNSLNLAGSTLTISSGPVNIYLHGTGTVNVDGAIINSGGLPTNLSIYCDTASIFDFNNNATFNGLLYAPSSSIIFNNNGVARGMLWGNNIDIKNNIDYLYDQALATKFSGVIAKVVRWKELF